MDPQDEFRPNKIEHSTSQKVSEGEIYLNKNEHTTYQEVSDGHGVLPSQVAPRSLRRSEWISCNTSIRSLAKTNGEKMNVRTHDTASWNDCIKLMTVESHLPTQQVPSNAITAQTSLRFPRGGCITDTSRRWLTYRSRFDQARG